jgi:succinate dehydrogenase/fumarate reductase flavoprotein subunit
VNPTNAGDGHAMAYHAGAELSGIECYQINPLIRAYNGPVCAYVANPIGGAAGLALATASREVAVEALVSASHDAHLDVRKAAMGSLSRWARDPDVSVALKAALDDADVRAIARHALRAGR